MAGAAIAVATGVASDEASEKGGEAALRQQHQKELEAAALLAERQLQVRAGVRARVRAGVRARVRVTADSALGGVTQRSNFWQGKCAVLGLGAASAALSSCQRIGVCDSVRLLYLLTYGIRGLTARLYKQ